MPLFDYLCLDCGKKSEILIAGSDDQPQCLSCGRGNLTKLLSVTSSMSGVTQNRMPGRGDTTCCGSNPEHAGCAGPGTCCGHKP